ncbi:MAG: sulfatase-like hydrolase/transferase [Phycisphaerales bacterium]|nr:MAG: sulfatase-like hydrolase/transferase [Phycisphaerales bacterium]
MVRRTRKRTSREQPSESGKPAGSRWLLGVAGVTIVVLVCIGLVFWPKPSGANPGSLKAVKSGAAAGYNVLVITLDTTRADHLGCYGAENAETPFLDGIAENGIVYADAVTPVPVTLPSHAAMFTGLYPPNNGVRNNGTFDLKQEYVTLAEVLKRSGYETAAFIAAFVLAARTGINQGFDTFDDEVDPTGAEKGHDFINERNATAVTDSAVRWFRNRKATKPFFAWVHYFDPHQPYLPPEPYASRFPRDPYAAEIAYADEQVGRLMTTVRELGYADRTIFLVLGDHGEGLDEHGEKTHAMLVYDSVMHVPLILSCPGIFQGPHVVDDVVVSTVDVFPTVLDLLGVPYIGPCDGISLLAGLDRERVVYVETMVPYLDMSWAALFGLRRHQDKYILAPRQEYYDLRNDPKELTNLFVDPPGLAATARDELVAMLDEMLARWPAPEEVAGLAKVLDPETIARLESLGYIGGGDTDPNVGKLDPKDMMPALNKILTAKALSGEGKNEEALALLNEVLPEVPESRKLLSQLAHVYLALELEEEAEDVLRRALVISPGPKNLALLAQILIPRGEYEEAEEYIKQALALDPNAGAAYMARGDLALYRQQFDDARSLYLYAGKVDPYRMGETSKGRLTALDRIEELTKGQR